MKNLNEITLNIKNEIKNHLIGGSFNYRGFPKTVNKFSEWNGPIEFNECFDLAEVPTMGKIEVSVKFTALVFFDIDGNFEAQSYLSGNYGPIAIDFSGSDYISDFSTATFSLVTTNRV